jgi:small-conductance mechanosensitive channel
MRATEFVVYLHQPARALSRTILLAAAAVLLAPFVLAQQPDNTGVPVRLEDTELFRVRRDMGPVTAEERAKAAEAKLYDLALNPFRPKGVFELREIETRTDVQYGDQTIVTVTEEDAAAEGVPRQQLAAQRLETIRSEVEFRRATYWRPRALLLGLLYTVLFTAAFVVVFRFFSRRLARVIARLESDAPLDGRLALIERVAIAGEGRGRRLVARMTRILRSGLYLAAAAVYVVGIMSFFPRTAFVVQALTDHALQVMATVWAGLTGYFPKLIFLAVIAVLTYYGIRLTKVFFDEVKRGSIELPSFDPDWAQPTYKIAAFLIVALALVMAFPYLPGSDSDAFKGVSLFLGLLISLSSSSAISNIISGVLLTYTSAFRIGDRVQIADAVGDIVEKTLFVTHLRTVRNVDIAIPNSQVLAGHIVNYSRQAQGTGVILNTSVTIGYDAPWRTVHELLVGAALDTAEILHDPKPFVLQKSLDDFYVSYELNAFTRNPWRMGPIYSELHQNIQDKFNEAGVEIMSPHYSTLRDGNQVTIPETYLPETYRPAAFRVLSTAPAARTHSGGDAP